jgi:hypothetical protein
LLFHVPLFYTAAAAAEVAEILTAGKKSLISNAICSVLLATDKLYFFPLKVHDQGFQT